jgi:glutamate-1-semialdehyde 2,1-aminomutase
MNNYKGYKDNPGHLFYKHFGTIIEKELIETLLKEERELYNKKFKSSKLFLGKATQFTPLGVSSNFQSYKPFPIYIESASGSKVKSIDGYEMLDLSMGFGSMQVGHNNPFVVASLSKQLSKGTLYVMPTVEGTLAAELLCKRFGVDQMRFVNSGTEALIYSIRVAKSYTGKNGVIKIEGGYHGGYDPLLVSVKPELKIAGRYKKPKSVSPKYAETGYVRVIPFNDIKTAEKIIKSTYKKIAALVVEPVMENIGIVLPTKDYLSGLKILCEKYNIILIFDEVKTGITAGYSGAAAEFNVKPDILVLGKSIGGGLPIAAFGGRKEIMSEITDRRAEHFGTYNANPLSIAAVIAVDTLANRENINASNKLNLKLLSKIESIIIKYKLPAYVTGIGSKGSVVWSNEIVKNYRGYKKINFKLAELQFLFYLNRGVITPPGLDEQWLLSYMHTNEDIDKITDIFSEFARKISN